MQLKHGKTKSDAISQCNSNSFFRNGVIKLLLFKANNFKFHITSTDPPSIAHPFLSFSSMLFRKH